jgi:CheY-like chemotaxis protein
MQTIPLSEDVIFRFSRLYREIKENKSRFKSDIILLTALLSKKSTTLLLADDDAGSREIFIEAIEQIAPHIKVNTVSNGKNLMTTLLSESQPLPDLIFLDLNMPLKTGRECLQEIRNNERLKEIPVIIYSTSSNDQHIDETYEDGANFYLIKPDSFNELKVIAKDVLSLDWIKPIWPGREKFVLVPTQFKQ